jgi:hypothetical protein
VVQDVLNELPSKAIKVYVVWEPIRLFDREAAARKSRALVPDRRARHFWAPDLKFAARVQAPIGLATEPAWDVYLLYTADAKWIGPGVPVPTDSMHQLSGRLPDAKLLDERDLTRRVRSLVDEVSAREPPIAPRR